MFRIAIKFENPVSFILHISCQTGKNFPVCSEGMPYVRLQLPGAEGHSGGSDPTSLFVWLALPQVFLFVCFCFFLCVCVWLHWVFIAVHGLSP